MGRFEDAEEMTRRKKKREGVKKLVEQSKRLQRIERCKLAKLAKFQQCVSSYRVRVERE